MAHEHKILDAYRHKNPLVGLVQLGGLAALVAGVVTDSSAISIAGGTGLGAGIIAEGIDYAKAYMEATLDFKANKKYTKLEE